MSRKKNRTVKRVQRSPAPLSSAQVAELPSILERNREVLSSEDHEKLKSAISLLGFLRAELQKNQTSLERLRRLLFGVSTEKTEAVLAGASQAPPPDSAQVSAPREPVPGHGRHGAAVYTGAHAVKLAHPTLQGGQACPGCERGRVYAMAEPSVLVRITGVAPLGATLYQCDRLRCNLCGELYTAPAPAGVGDQKYEATAVSMIGLLKYGTGLPFNRIETLQAGMRIPLPAATQWDLVKAAARQLAPVYEALIAQAAQAVVLHNDDTSMKVLKITREQRAAALAEDADEARSGVFTSAILATGEGHKIALFFTGVRHAGENLAALLKARAAELPAPIQMCDGLAHNAPRDFDTLLANCIAHARRRYVELAESFPEQVRFVLETLREIYKTDATARKLCLSAQARLELHQAESGPRMTSLEQWMKTQFEQRLVEPNSSLGEAIAYMQNRWSELTLFLREPDAPLDNNVCERALKKVILHRKNALFYRTLNGASVGDVFMSLIHTAELHRAAPFDYLVALLRHAEQVRSTPGEWLPWNYATALARHTAGADPPALPA